MKFEKIGFIGFGLIGGSIALKIKELKPDTSIIATASRESTVTTAFNMGLIENSSPLTVDSFGDCDLIFLCAPVERNIDYIRLLKDVIKPDCIITDVGSTKNEIHQAVLDLGMECNFIGGHPMTGSEKTGIENADALLLENAYYMITPTNFGAVTEEADEAGKEYSKNVELFRQFVLSLGSIPMVLDYRRHDYATASISHLPHMISFALTNLVKEIDDENETMKTISAGSFRDMTRVAASSPVMWQNICQSNKDQILKLMDLYENAFAHLKEMIENSDNDGIMDYFQSAKDYRDSLHVPSKNTMNQLYEIYVDLADESGAIAIIASLLAFRGVNIKNIGIINNREFEEGVLRIEFSDPDEMELACQVLAEKNYIIHKR